ncbi:MAG: putative rane protein [Rhodoferax sp.]|nr:putative rane protein [Rhodoferax sp.]
MTHWLREGLRAGVLLKPRIPLGQPPTPLQMLLLVVLPALLALGLARLEVIGPGYFYARGWLVGWWSTGALVFAVWCLLRPGAVAAWLGLWMVAMLPVGVVSQALVVARAHEALPASVMGSGWQAWAVYVFFWCWTLAVAARLAKHFGAGWLRQAGLVLSVLALGLLTQWQVNDRPWYPEAEAGNDAPGFTLSQQVFEAQQQLWTRQVAELAPQRPGVTDVYGLVFAPFAGQDVFLRESSMVAGVLRQRFDAEGRVLQLVNDASAAQDFPWATPLNLTRAIDAIAARMDRDNDVLVVYLTSHGASNFHLSAEHGPLEVEPLTPQLLRTALDQAGIRNRVIAVSACFSGGWVAPLAGDHTLVMTAADATHTSYGCGRKSALTFFGRAMFDEQLRKTTSFEDAFAAAVPVIRQREDEAGKEDGFSNPQISVGAQIRPVLTLLQQRLAAKP